MSDIPGGKIRRYARAYASIVDCTAEETRSRCTVLINGICHRALRCISCFMLYARPAGLCFGLCFTPSVQRGIDARSHVCIMSQRSAFFSPANHIALPCRTLCLRFLSLVHWLKRDFLLRGILAGPAWFLVGADNPRYFRTVVTANAYFLVFIPEIIPPFLSARSNASTRMRA